MIYIEKKCLYLVIAKILVYYFKLIIANINITSWTL